MNPDANSQHNFNLPSPVAEAQPTPVETQQPQHEQPMTAAPEAVGNQPLYVPPAMAAQNDAQQLVASQAQSAMAPTNPAPTQAQAANNDAVIDKEWVLKAKQIVQQSVNDPYTQNKQLAQIKSDYLLKRYGRVVKLAD